MQTNNNASSEKLQTFDSINKINNDEQQLENTSASTVDKSSSLIMRIFSRIKEFLLLFAFLLTFAATIQNNSPKISRANPPLPFFSRGSFVEDYYYGQLAATQTKVTLSDLSFVFYYAPWSSDCRHARHPFENVSRIFYKEAYFSAINCWQPGSECRNQYSKIVSWPILMAYQRNGFGIQYQRNLWTEAALTKFITSLLNPIQRLTSPEHLLEMMTARDSVIVAFIDLQAHPRHYNVFYRTALKFLERDPFNEIGFGIVVGESSTEFGVEKVPAIRAYLWNETVEYSGNFTWTSRELIKWVHENIQQVSLHLSPPGTKSSSIAPYLKQGPIMILFNPRNFYVDIPDSYVMLRQLGMEYYNCKNDDWVREVAHDYLFQKRKENRENLKKLHMQCLELVQEIYQSDSNNRKCSSSVSYVSVLNSSKNFESKINKLSNFCEIDEMKVPNVGKCRECSSETCEMSKYKYKKYTYGRNKKEESGKYQTSMLDNNEDERSPEAIERYNFRRKCEMLRLAEKKADLLFIDDESTAPLELISGLACKSNKTFTLISMDSNNFHTFAERLGIDILEIENKTAALIMDQENESTYLLDEPINLSSIARFLYTYHRDGLGRFLRTNSIQYKHTHFFDINEFLNINKREINEEKERDKKMCKADNKKKRTQSHVVIREIYSEEFDTDVIKSNKTIVILFYSTNCAFCSIMSHSLLTVSRILEHMPNIEFLRIDGDKNDLAWHYTMSEFPSLLVFPSDSKSESRKFPSKMSMNITNVLGFVLANLNRSYRLLGLVMACNYKRQNSTNDCIISIQEEISDTISFALREWRKHSRKRAAILRIIKQLKEIYLKLFRIQNSCDFIEIESDVMRLSKRWYKAMVF